MHRLKAARGFTLIEILIALALVAILATIAYPSYASAIRRAHRAEAQGYMLALALREQRYMSDARTFTANIGTLGVSPPTDLVPFYSFAIATPNDTTFVITATAIGSQVDDGNLTLDQSGARMPTSKW